MPSPGSHKKVFFLTPYPIGIAPGQRFRFEQYFTLLSDHGYTLKVFPFLSSDIHEVLYQPGNNLKKLLGVLSGFLNRWVSLPQLASADFIFIFREAAPIGPPLFEWLLAKVLKRKIIYDFDDAIWLPNTSPENWLVAHIKWPSKVGHICRWSYRVSCGNSYLVNYAKAFNSRVLLNPTTLDTEFLHNPSLHAAPIPKETVNVGWTGTHSTLKYLDPLLPVLDALYKKYPQVRFVVIADRKPQWSMPFLVYIPWNKQTEISDLMQIDMGIMPLTDDAWARGKCGFKALQYLSLEKPALVSPVGVNSEIVEHNSNGYLCSTAEDWFNQLEHLIVNPAERERLGRNAREKVIRNYSVASNSGNFLRLFD